MSDADDLRELAQRLLSHPHPEGPTTIELFVQRLPDAWGEIPSPPGSQLLGSALHLRRGRPTLIEAVYDADGDSATVFGQVRRGADQERLGRLSGL
jgi:hypothetical protein